MPRHLPALAVAGFVLVAGAGALAQAEADRRLDAAIERLRTALGPAATLQIGRRQVDPVSGRAVLSDVVVTEGQNRLQVAEVILTEVSDTRIGRAEATRPSYRDGDGQLLAATRLLLAGMPLPPPGGSIDLANLAFDALEIEAATMADTSGQTGAVGRVAIRNWRPQGIEAAAFEGAEFRGGGQSPDMRLGRLAVEAVVLPITAGDFDATRFRAGRLVVEGAEMKDPVQQVEVAFGRLALADWIPGKPGELALEGLRMAGSTPQLGRTEARLGRAAASGVDFATLASAIETGTGMPQLTPGLPQRFVIEGLTATSEGQPLLALGRFASEGVLDGGIARGGMALEGLRITPPANDPAWGWLGDLGYREMAGGMELRGSQPIAGGTLSIAPFGIAWQEAAALSLDARLEDMPAAPDPATKMDSPDTLAAYAAARLGEARLTLRDQGLLGRILAVQARQQRQPEARLREQWAQMALAMPVPGAPPPQQPRRGGPPVKDVAPAADPFAPMREAVARFIRQPGTLEIAVRPPKPIPFAELSSLAGEPPVQTIQRLGLSITAR